MKGHGQLMALLNGWNKKIGKLMVGTGNGGFAADGRPGEKNSGLRIFAGCEKISQLAKISQPGKFPGRKLPPAH